MMRIYKVGSAVRLTKKQPKGSNLLEKYPCMRGVVIYATLGMTRVKWMPEGTEPGEILHYNTEIIRCNKMGSNAKAVACAAHIKTEGVRNDEQNGGIWAG